MSPVHLLLNVNGTVVFLTGLRRITLDEEYAFYQDEYQ